jgi:hypothetical protein
VAYTQWAARPEDADLPPPVTDTTRLEWLLPVLELAPADADLSNQRSMALAAALMMGKSGRDALDFAMEGSR